MNYKCFIILISLFILLLNSCIDDNVVPPLTGDLIPSAELLVYFENQGDFINSFNAPPLVDAEEVYQNMDSYPIIDIRPREDFLSGHIKGSLNITTDSLFNYFQNLEASLYKKIIIVSGSGQSSAYFACLLRLAGIDNVYSMNFGLASWNEIFANEWLEAIGDDPNVGTYTNDDFPKNDYTNLPDITFDNPDAQIEEKTKSRIKKIMSAGFVQDINYVYDFPEIGSRYLVCYGLSRLYFSPIFGPLGGLGHRHQVVYYMSEPVFELRSVNYLQTLPTDRKILLYDETGQMGACMVAYLRVLGYDAESLLFGGNHLVYSRVKGDDQLKQFAFDISDIKNYPYITN